MLTPSQEAEIREFIVRNRQSMYPYVMTDAMADMMDTIDELRNDVARARGNVAILAPDARRWRAVKPHLGLVAHRVGRWEILGSYYCKFAGPLPADLDTAAEQIAAGSEATND